MSLIIVPLQTPFHIVMSVNIAEAVGQVPAASFLSPTPANTRDTIIGLQSLVGLEWYMSFNHL